MCLFGQGLNQIQQGGQHFCRCSHDTRKVQSLHGFHAATALLGAALMAAALCGVALPEAALLKPAPAGAALLSRAVPFQAALSMAGLFCIMIAAALQHTALQHTALRPAALLSTAKLRHWIYLCILLRWLPLCKCRWYAVTTLICTSE